MDVGAFSQHELAHQSTSDSEDEDADTSSELSDGDDLAVCNLCFHLEQY